MNYVHTYVCNMYVVCVCMCVCARVAFFKYILVERIQANSVLTIFADITT